MLPAVLSSSTCGSDEDDCNGLNNSNQLQNSESSQDLQKAKKKRRLPGNPDPDAEVIALSPETLLATNRFVCEICNKGFQRDQNLQLHRRGHNLPWKLKHKDARDPRKKAYVCPEPMCVHHHPSRALGDLTGIKKHYCRKHGEKKWKCDKCSKVYAVQSDWKAHSKTCGSKEYRCDCGSIFTRKDSFITHRAFCDALAEESARISAPAVATAPYSTTASAAATPQTPLWQPLPPAFLPFASHNRHFPNLPPLQNPNPNYPHIKYDTGFLHIPLIHPPLICQDKPLMPSFHLNAAPAPLSATALLQKAEAVGHMSSTADHLADAGDGFTRDFLGLATADKGSHGGGDNSGQNVGEMLTYARGVQYQGFGYAETCGIENWGN